MSESKNTPTSEEETPSSIEVTSTTSSPESTPQVNTADSAVDRKTKEKQTETSEDDVPVEKGNTPSTDDASPTSKPEASTPQSNKGKANRDSFNLTEGLKALEELKDKDAKLVKVIELMEQSIAQTGAPSFRGFWELRKLAMELFKENITPAIRPQLWERFTELTKEARQLKEILDEQSAFAVEQIEIAITALEGELNSLAQLLEKVAPVDFGTKSESLKPKFSFYNAKQKELNLLNAHAGRVNALRKELIKTDMRVRQKNQFFQRLSSAGDLIFPQRKKLIKEVSEQFIQDIDGFVKEHFSGAELGPSLFFLRQEIKSLQSIAKILTLNTHSFTHTRTQLSGCWNRVKDEEKERKKERTKARAIYKERAEVLRKKMDATSQALSSGELSLTEAKTQFDTLNDEMRATDLGRDEGQNLRDQLRKAREPLFEAQRAEEAKRQEEKRQKEQVRRGKVNALEQRIDTLLTPNPELTLEGAEKERDAIAEALKGEEVTRSERIMLERRLKPVRDIIIEKRELALMSLSQDDQNALAQLRQVLEERLSLRNEIKTQLEYYRKAAGASGLDFEQAIEFNTQQTLEKERLDKTNVAIRDIETKITELKSKL